MLLGTTTILLQAFNKCPKCEETLTTGGLDIYENLMKLKCKCGWGLVVEEFENKK